MTLLVTGLNIPKINGMITSGTVDSIFIGLFPDFIHYIVAFILLASFWWASHLISHYFQTISTRMSFTTITMLLFVGLIPFSTNLAGDFPLNSHAVIVFELNLFVFGLLSVIQWNEIIADTMNFAPDADLRMMLMSREEAYIFPVLSLLAILLAIVSVPWGILIYLVAPVYILLIWKRETRSQTVRQKSSHKAAKSSRN